MRIQFIIVSWILISSTVFGQSKNECQKLLDKEISASTFNENLDGFLNDFKTLISCEFDEIDYQIFMGPQGNMPFIATALITLAGKIENENKYTFGDLKETLLSFKENPEYLKVRNIVEAQNTLIKKSASIKNWKNDEKLFEKMGLVKTEREEIYAIVKENENKPYSEIFIIYSNILRAKKEKEITENQNKIDKLKSNNPESVEWIKGLLAYNSYDLGLKKSKELNKPMLLYFNGYACVNARKVEEYILNEYEIQNYINTNLIFVNLLVDDKKELEDNQKFYSEILNKQIKTVGQKNIEFQINKYNASSQPLFVLLDIDGNEISRIGYTRDINKFNSFLKQTEE